MKNKVEKLQNISSQTLFVIIKIYFTIYIQKTISTAFYVKNGNSKKD